MDRMDYGIEVYGLPKQTWLGVPSDEADEGGQPEITTDPAQAARFEKFSDARRACKDAARQHADRSFRVSPLPVIAA